MGGSVGLNSVPQFYILRSHFTAQVFVKFVESSMYSAGLYVLSGELVRLNECMPTF